MRGKRHSRRSVLLATGIVGGLTTVAVAQGEAGGKILRLTIGQSLQYSDNIDVVANPDGGTLRSATRVNLAYSDITRTQSFQFVTGGSFEVGSDGETGWNEPFARLSYARTGANSTLDFSASYRRTDLDDAFSVSALSPLDDTDPEPDDTPVNDIAQIESGNRIDSEFTAGFETGLQSNVGLRLDVSEKSRRYSGVTDPDLFETSDRRVNLVTTFRIDPQITARATASARHYTAEDADRTDRTEKSVAAGVNFRVAPDTTLDLSLGHKSTEVERLSGTSETDGVTYGATLDRALPNGSIQVSFDSVNTLNGRRNTLRANRSMLLPRDASLSYGIGVTKTEGLSSEPLFSVSYSQPLKRGRFGVTLSQEARTDEENDDAVIVTLLSANYATALSPTMNWTVGADLNDISARAPTGEDRRRITLRSNLSGQINPISSWSAGINFTDTSTTSATAAEDQRRYGVQLAYRRELAQDWDLVARYQHTSILNSNDPDRRSNAISLGVEKTFAYRP